MSKPINLKKLVLTSAIITGAAFAFIQFVPVYARTNPPVAQEKTLAANVSLPPQMQTIMNKACMDCHSNETKWPWYAKIAPMSWLVARDVEHARHAINFSEWSDQAGKRKGTAIGALMAACEGVKDQKMPLPQYQMMHPEARLSQDEIKSFCTWTVAAVRQIKSGKGVAEHAGR